MTVEMKRLDHVNVRTSKLDEMVDWYGRMLGMKPEARPEFPFPGAWLYVGQDAVLHLIAVDAEPGAEVDDLKLEHFALRATGMKELLQQAKASGDKVEVRKVPGFPIVQVNMWDPDGNHIHIDFDVAEAEAAGVV